MSNYYVDKKKLYDELVKYNNKKKKAEDEGTELPQASDYIGQCIMNIAEGMSKRGNFNGYSFRNEMVSDGIENAVMAMKNFDPEKSDNPYGYFYQVIWYAFLRRIEKESKHSYIKHKAGVNLYFEYITHPGNEGIDFSEMIDDEKAADLVEKFEKKKKK